MDEPAFPIPADQHDYRTQGMTLRDYFAAKAMQGELASQSEDNGVWHKDLYDKLAELSYKLADAMLEARKRGE